MRVIGLDLGQTNDPAAAAVIERDDRVPTPETVGGDDCVALPTINQVTRESRNQYWPQKNKKQLFVGPPYPYCGKLKCISLKRWNIGTDYNDIVNDVLSIPFDFLVPDFCGVGRPVVDMLRREHQLRRHKGKIRPVLTVSSNALARTKSTATGQLYDNVPKIEMVAAIEIAQQQGKLELPPIPETRWLLGELLDYRMRYSKAANQQFGADPHKSNAHDDLVAALGLAVWWCGKAGNRRLSVYMG